MKNRMNKASTSAITNTCRFSRQELWPLLAPGFEDGLEDFSDMLFIVAWTLPLMEKLKGKKFLRPDLAQSSTRRQHNVLDLLCAIAHRTDINLKLAQVQPLSG